MLKAAEDEFRALGCGIVEVISNRRFSEAHGFYEACGFEQSSLKFKKRL